MRAFEPFANDSQVVVIATGDDELTLENGTESILLTGTLVINRNDGASRQRLEHLQRMLSQVLAELA